MSRPTKCVVDLEKLKSNYTAIKTHAKTKVLALVKADAYGHGLVECAKALESIDADYLGTASLEEALILRQAGIRIPILCVGALPLGSEQLCIDAVCEQAVSSVLDIQRIQRAASADNVNVCVHLKIETGMHRTGVEVGAELEKVLTEIKNSSNVKLKGVFTHFSCADTDEQYTMYQADVFKKAVKIIKEFGFTDIMVHCSNSAAISKYPQLSFDMVRAGIILYGYYPTDDMPKNIKVSPVLSFKTSVVTVNALKKGQKVSYGATFTADRDMRIAVLPVGYGDGYKRCISNKGVVLINGKRAKVLGRVCMDMTMVDVTDIDASIGDEVVLIGDQKGERLDADELASWCDTISYEIMLSITKRVPKFYE